MQSEQSSKGPGILYLLEDGSKAIGYHKEQEKAFGDRILIHHITDDWEPKKCPTTGKNLKGLKNIIKLKIIGYVD